MTTELLEILRNTDFNLTNDQHLLIKSIIRFKLQKPFKKGDIVVLKERSFSQKPLLFGSLTLNESVKDAKDWYGKNIKYEVECCVDGIVFGRKILNGSGKKQEKISMINQSRLVDIDPTYMDQLLLGDDVSPLKEVEDFVKNKKQVAKHNRKLVL